MNIFKLKNNRYKSEKIRSYKEFQKDNYKYRVDEILEDMATNDKKYIELVEESEILYKELKSMLDEKGQKKLLNYTDTCWNRQGYSEQHLAEQVYEDLKI